LKWRRFSYYNIDFRNQNRWQKWRALREQIGGRERGWNFDHTFNISESIRALSSFLNKNKIFDLLYRKIYSLHFSSPNSSLYSSSSFSFHFQSYQKSINWICYTWSQTVTLLRRDFTLLWVKNGMTQSEYIEMTLQQWRNCVSYIEERSCRDFSESDSTKKMRKYVRQHFPLSI
jgi:hypothetical protein